jgi:hypothetical protein
MGVLTHTSSTQPSVVHGFPSSQSSSRQRGTLELVVDEELVEVDDVDDVEELVEVDELVDVLVEVDDVVVVWGVKPKSLPSEQSSPPMGEKTTVKTPLPGAGSGAWLQVRSPLPEDCGRLPSGWFSGKGPSVARSQKSVSALPSEGGPPVSGVTSPSQVGGAVEVSTLTVQVQGPVGSRGRQVLKTSKR